MLKKVLILCIIEIFMFAYIISSPPQGKSLEYLNGFENNNYSLLAEKEAEVIIATENVLLRLKENTQISVTIFKDSNVASLDFSLLYDSDVINIVDLKLNEGLSGNFIFSKDHEGILNITYTQEENINDLQILFDIIVSIKDPQYAGESIRFSLNENYSNEFYTIIDDELITIEKFSFEFGTMIVGLLGDVNLDDVVDIEDAILIQMMVIDKIELTPQQLKLADVTFDGEVDAVDAMRIQYYLLDILDTLDNFTCKVSFMYSDKIEVVLVKKGWYLTELPPVPKVSGYVLKWDISENTKITSDLEVHPIYYMLPTSIQISGTYSLYEGEKYTFKATVHPSHAFQDVIWTSSNEEVATVDNQGNVTALKQGDTIITVSSALYSEVFNSITLNVKSLTPPQPIPDMKNYEIIIMVPAGMLHEHDPHCDDYSNLDKQYKLAAWAEVEDKFNTRMTVSEFPEDALWGPARINYIINNASQNKAETDIFVSTTDWVVQFASKNATIDVLEFYEKYGRNSMNPGIKAASMYKGGLYALPANDFGTLNVKHGLVFNLNMLERLKIENPAKLFNEGKWTWSEFKKYVEDATKKLTDEESVLSGKPSSLFYGMTAAAGLTLVDPNLMMLNFSHGYAILAANLIKDLYAYDDKVWGDNAWDAENPSFNDGKSLFQVAEYWFIKDDSRFQKDMWGYGSTRFGFVPFPYPDSLDKNETRIAYQGGEIYQMSAGRVYPNGITSEYIYRAWTEMMFGTTRKMKDDPDLNEDLLMMREAQFKLDDEESMKAVTFFKRDKVIWDTFYSILPPWQYAGPMIDKVVIFEVDYMKTVYEYELIYRDALDKAYG